MLELETKKEYTEAVNYIAQTVIDDAIEHENVQSGKETVWEWSHGNCWEYIDNSPYLIYPCYHSKILEHTETDIEDIAENGCIEPTTDLQSLTQSLAFYTLLEDVGDAISNILEE